MLGLAAAGALLAFGARLLAAGRRAGPSLILGLFALFWGMQVVLVRLWAMDQQAGRVYLLASLAFGLPLYLLVVHFAAVFPRRTKVSWSRWWLPALAAPAAAWLVLVALQPGAAAGPSGPGRLALGWASMLLIGATLMLGFAFALTRFALGFLRASDPGLRRPLELCTLGLLVYVAYYIPDQVWAIPSNWPVAVAQYGVAVAAAYHSAVLAAMAGLVFAAGALVVRTRGRARARWMAAAVVPAVAAAVFGGVDPSGGLLGLMRLALVGFLAYAVAKHNFLDLDLRLRASARPLSAAAIGLATWGFLAAAIGVLAGARWSDAPEMVLGTAMAGLLAAALSWRPVSRWLDLQFPYIRATDEYLLRRRLEVFRAALEDGAPLERLDALARDLKLKDRERSVVERGLAGAPPAVDYASGLGPGGRYKVERELARGVYGPVLLAYDARLGERVVIKEYRGLVGPAAGRSFAREALALGALEHPGAIRVIDVFSAGADYFVVLEHADGGSLDDLLERRRAPLALDEALPILESVLAALAGAHKRGVVHRDLKPSNVLFVKGKPKIADFGIALDPVLDGAVRASAAQPGTIGWMSPEQARGDPVAPSSDVYAAGAVLYRMLAGRHYLPIGDATEQAARRAVVLRDPELPLPGVPRAVNDVLAKALAKDPARRYPDAGAMLRALRKAARQPRPPAPSGSPQRTASAAGG